MKPTKEQDKFFTWMKNGKGNAIIEALAGTGKTTTIIVAANIIPPSDRAIFLAFNKDIIKELKEKQKQGKMSKEIDVRTFNSLGHISLLKGGYKSQNFDTKYLTAVIEKQLKEFDEDLEELDAQGLIEFFKNNRDMLYDYRDQISMCKVNMALTKEEIIAVSRKHAFSTKQHHIDFVYEFLHKVYLSGQRPDKFDYKDQVFLPAINAVSVPKYDWIFVDECQDLNKAQHALLLKMMHQGTRVIAVGDPSQAIYGFNGADAASFRNLSKILPNVSIFPLTTCFRCKERIIKFVNSAGVNTSIKHHTTNNGGTVRYGSYKEIDEGDLVLCRTNAPLYQLFEPLHKMGKKVSMRGDRQMIETILNRLNYAGRTPIQTVLNRELEALERYGKYLARNHSNYADITLHPKYVHRREYYDIMANVAKIHNCKTGKQLRYFVNKVFNDHTDKIQLLTIHRSKGLEGERIFILGDDLTPHKLAKEPWEEKQENNLIYVSYTRAKSELIFINDFEDFVSRKEISVAHVSIRFESTFVPLNIG